MLRTLLAAFAAVGVVLFFGCAPSHDGSVNMGAPSSGPQPVASTLLTGSGAPSGAHYNLEIIGVPKGKTATITTGNRIFVPLFGSCKIMLTEGDFAVLDANGTDGSAAFQLPNPDPLNTGTTTYSVFARALGKPGGTSTTTTAAIDPLTGDVYYSVYSYVAVRGTGGSKFQNVSQQLLYVYADVLGTGTVQRYPLFDSALQDYFWQYDNNGLKNLQLRFYEVTTTVK
jgi:hypothetical protein